MRALRSAPGTTSAHAAGGAAIRGRQIAWTSPVPILSMFYKYVELVLRHLELVWRLHAATPSVDLLDASAHVFAAEAASTDQLTPELLLGIAYVESRFDPTAVSRIEGHTRKTGSYPSRVAPARLDRHASLFCGPLQAFAASWSDCLGLRDLRAGYAAGAAELSCWLRDRRVHGDVTRALAGHGCGNLGVITGKCNGYPQRVLAVQRWMHFGSGRRGASRESVASW
jgi:hypothetical protein